MLRITTIGIVTRGVISLRSIEPKWLVPVATPRSNRQHGEELCYGGFY